MPADQTLSLKAGDLNNVSSRYHDLALRRWLYHLFFVKEGYPVPVVFASAMDAFAQFQRLWADDKNPFSYLLDLKDDTGKPLYEPHPSPVRYPLLSVYKRGLRYRNYQNFSYHRWRRFNWPTVSDDVDKCDLANVTTSQMPMAWDYRYQIDHFCLRPDTQAFFMEKLMWEMWRTGGIPQTWVLVDYPGWGQQLARLYIEGDIENSTPDAPNDGEHVEYRTTIQVVLEGFSVDVNYKILPALWELVFRNVPPSPDELDRALNVSTTSDLRIHDNNVTLDSRSSLPPEGDCEIELQNFGAPFTGLIDFTDDGGVPPSGGVGNVVVTGTPP